MQKSHMPEITASLIGLADLYGKPHPTAAAAIHWWETLKEFDYNDVMGCLGYWAKESTVMPSPKAVWDKLNSKRTESIEERAARERASNRAMIPHDFRPTPQGRRMIQECLRIVSQPRRKEGRQGWANKIMQMVDDGERVPYLTQQIAQRRLAEVRSEEVTV
jgi:hypothetical protein